MPGWLVKYSPIISASGLLGIVMFTIGQVAKRYSLSRSTLLYYDSIGILTPSGRSDSNYRLYSSGDLERMDRVMLFRQAGLSLESISVLLERKNDEINAAYLEDRLYSINKEIQALRNQQKVILKVLENKSAISNTRVMTKASWISLLEAAGLDETGMKKWHEEFEKTSPEAHQDFLESIGIENDEIAWIREWSIVTEN